MKQYLDVNGGKYLTTKMKTYVDDKVKNLPAGGTGTVDLTNYYTKKETDDLLKNITGGGGTGATGKDGVGISSIKLVNYELIVALTDGTEHNLGNVRGEKGDKGATGAKGADGRNGIDGAKGTDGVSPTVSVTATTNGHTVVITDVNGTQSFEVLNGKDGKDGASGGSSGGGGGASTDVYSTEEVQIGTWIDGKTIYRSIIDMQLPSSSKAGAPVVYSYKHGLSIDTIVDERMFTPTFNIKSFFNNLGFAPINLAKISSIATLKDYLIRVAVTPTEIMVDYGYWWNDTKLKCIIDYTKK